MVKFTKKYPSEWNLPVEILILCIDFNTIRQIIKIYGMPTCPDCIAAPSPSSRKKLGLRSRPIAEDTSCGVDGSGC